MIPALEKTTLKKSALLGLKPEMMKLLGSTKNNIIKDKTGENVSHLQITEVVLVHCNIVNNDHQQVLRILYLFLPSRTLGKITACFTGKKSIILKFFN